MLREFTPLAAHRLDEFCQHQLESTGLIFPPVDAFQLAALLRFEVVFDVAHPQRASCVTLRHGNGGQRLIVVRPEERVERLHWAVAHELGEFFAAEAIRTLGTPVDDVEPPHREWLANQLARRLLVPSRPFFVDLQRLDGDLIALKNRFSTASYEVLARRMLDATDPSVITIMDQGRITFRRSNVLERVPGLTAMEKVVWLRAHQTGLHQREESESEQVQAWAIHEPGWKREIIRTTAAWMNW
ncbi:MAG: ImmA/IrrE family metallo-endopeptidase [Thermogutta sp.]|uniref:ImmA/IrrE family metallo-endopeptidase n=1 Tax=Thermogutta sp. TaxID=1962930 RepID=UPI0019B7EF7A|nr:ImmA/IrrE family metallo-endopeptidase [Thermogutta sp.]MBC7352096.1 ImmA/IrrE family metallo-endopeptidase [Thermogutta sp.]